MTHYRALRNPPRLGSGRSRTARLSLARHRTELAAALLLAAIWVTIRAASPSPPDTVAIVVAAQDLPAGHQLIAEDLTTAQWPADLPPGGKPPGEESSTQDPYAANPSSGNAFTGQILSGPIQAGEPVTDARVLGPGLLEGLAADMVAVPVRLTDPASAALVRPGDHVDVLASTAATWSAEEAGASSTLSSATTQRAARNALVLSAFGTSQSQSGGSGGGFSGMGGAETGSVSGDSAAGMLVLAIRASEVDRLAGATAGSQVSVAVLP